jgi:glucose-6-phosphate-specific signal transduction histidine kinase
LSLALAAIQVTHKMDDVKVDKKFRVTAFRIIEALFNNCLDSIRSGELRIEIQVVDKKLEITFDVPGVVLDQSALHMAAEARLHQVKGKLKSRLANAGVLLEVTIPLPKST